MLFFAVDKKRLPKPFFLAFPFASQMAADPASILITLDSSPETYAKYNHN